MTIPAYKEAYLPLNKSIPAHLGAIDWRWFSGLSQRKWKWAWPSRCCNFLGNNIVAHVPQNIWLFLKVFPGRPFVFKYWAHVSIAVLDMTLKFLSASFFKAIQNALHGPRWDGVNTIKYLFWKANDSIVKLMVSIISGVSLWYTLL